MIAPRRLGRSTEELQRCDAIMRGACWLIGIVCLLTGCRSASSDIPSVSASAAIDDPAAANWRPITFVDKPELQSGVGEMDSQTPPEFSSTPSGLKYRILRSSGGAKPTAAGTVTVKYRGWLDNGTVFDSSYERGKPTTFPLQNVIAAWTEGLQLVGQGGMIELWVPSRLGYGEQGSPGSIPPHANLHFIVELVSID